ncbi:MAG: DUF1360 domain-containing protein [Acidimicrobiales bacterium]
MHPHDDPRPLESYGLMMGVYGSLAGAAVYGLRNKGDRVRRVGAMDLVVLGLATQHLTRLISKDAITAPLRAPFTEFEGPAGEGEVNERVTGTGLRHAVGELLACPFCLGQWAATALVSGSIAAPRLGTAAATTLAVAQLSDYLHLVYAALRHRN